MKRHSQVNKNGENLSLAKWLTGRTKESYLSVKQVISDSSLKRHEIIEKE